MGPGFDAGELVEAVFAVALACGLVHDIFVNLDFAGNQKVFAVAALHGFELVLWHVFVVAVKGVNADSSQCEGAQNCRQLFGENAKTAKINSGQCGKNTY